MNSFTNLCFKNIKQNDVGCWEFMKEKPQLYNSQHSFISVCNMFYILLFDIQLGLRMEITDEVFQSFYLEEKIIDSDISWNRIGKAYITDHIQIINQTIIDFDVNFVCNVTKYNKWAFIIYYSRTHQILVKYDTIIHPPNQRDKHTNLKMDAPHKHKFKEGCRKNLTAKIIPTIEIDSNDINKALAQFFKECNIRFEGDYIPLILPNKGLLQTQLLEFDNPIFEHRKRGGET